MLHDFEPLPLPLPLPCPKKMRERIWAGAGRRGKGIDFISSNHYNHANFYMKNLTKLGHNV